jgi:uncharacterized heparinase superfamily protein
LIARLKYLFHTLRHLKPVQFHARLWFRLYRPQPRTGLAPGLRMGRKCFVAVAPRRASLLGPGQLRLLNEDVSAVAAGDWQGPGRSDLLRYNLHYFDDLNALDAGARREWQLALSERWIAGNPPAVGVGWAPYPTSLRIVNWIKASLAGLALPESARQSLAVQARQLERRLEWHLLGNHLFANAKALVFAGCWFDGDEAARWRAKGLRIVDRELPEQVLADGGQFERSPMYHALALEDLLDLINLAGVYPDCLDAARVAQWREVAARMWRWLLLMCHPDGEISFFNDAAIGVAPQPSYLYDYARRLGIEAPAAPGELEQLQPSGYLRLELGSALLLIDAAAIGPDYLPGHGHADTLSFELSLHGQRVLVNSGIDRYGADAERVRQRGSAAHNCVVVDGEDSSEVWSGFRVARRAYPFDLMVERREDEIVVECAHDGYRRLPGRVVHRRQWRLRVDGLRITDRIEGECSTVVTHFHLHPAVSVGVGEGLRSGEMRMGEGALLSWEVHGGRGRVVASEYRPEFGVSVPSAVLEVDLGGSRQLVTEWRW